MVPYSVERRKQLAQIHIGVAALGWSEADYRAILQAKTGKSSASELDGTGRLRFIEHLRHCGWAAPSKRFTQHEKIEWLWKKLCGASSLPDHSTTALLAFAARVTGSAVSDVRFIPPAAASKVIEALKARLKRAQ